MNYDSIKALKRIQREAQLKVRNSGVVFRAKVIEKRQSAKQERRAVRNALNSGRWDNVD